MTEAHADVTVVIPSYNRPVACRGAILSALGQTLPPREVLLVVDGVDTHAYASLEDDIADKRLRVLRPGRQQGPSGVRNLGVAEASSPCVAFLDDDDYWLPDKLERQLAFVHQVVGDAPFVSTTAIAALRVDQATRWPLRDPSPGEPVADFLFGLGAPPRGGRVIQTSTFLTTRDLALATPMRGRAYEDWDWLIRASLAAPHVHVPEPLVIFHQAAGSLTSKLSLAEAEAWLEGLRPLISHEAYAAACLTVLANRGAVSGSSGDLMRIYRQSFQGKPHLRHLVEFPARVLSQRRKQRPDR
jgi:glycosyltransferase involved in cell wall biosynthesis